MNAGDLSASFEALRQFTRQSRPAERCELCGADVGEGHPHLLEPQARRLVCACRACAILFSAQGSTKYKRVPEKIRYLAGFCLSDPQWESLMIPINMAFFFESSPLKKMVAIYPSPAGATESLLPLETWSDMLAENPVLGEMEADVEALLVNRLGPTRGFQADEYYILPIDECYGLVGLIRKHWRGLSGGTELWAEMESFFARLRERAVGHDRGAACQN